MTNEETLAKIEANTLKLEDTFQFECKACGQCCRNRSEPIIMTGCDLFRLAKALNLESHQVVEKYMYVHFGKDSHVPVLTLRERQDGSCSLLRNGKCTVHENKPIVCALYPLGRMCNVEQDEYTYFTQETPCNSGRTWTLQEWLDSSNIQAVDKMSKAWLKILTCVVDVTSKIKIENIEGKALGNVLFAALYAGYDTNKPYEEEVERNIEVIQGLFKLMRESCLLK